MIRLRFYNWLWATFAFGAGLSALGKDQPSTTANIQDLSLRELEQRRADIETELDTLAQISMRSGVGSIGYRSMPHMRADFNEWIQIQLDDEVPLDEIILIPAIWRDAQVGFVSDGFPIEFKIVTGTSQDKEGTEIASFTKEDNILPRIAPLIIPTNNIQASWIRLEATLLSPRAYDSQYILQMSEILIMSGDRNLALKGSVTTSSESRAGSGAWHKSNLIKGFLPYLMDAVEGPSSLAYVSGDDIHDTPTITIDLEAPYSIDEIYLHGVEQGDTVPQAYAGDFGVPKWLQIVGATQADFSDEKVLLDLKVRGSLDTAPILMLPLNGTTSRFIKLVAREPYQLEGFDNDGIPLSLNRIGFSEIEIISQGKNLALGKTPTTNFNAESAGRSILALTDGLNLYGKILLLKDWMYQLAKRHDLEIERPIVQAELEHRYNRQATLLSLLTWVVAGLIAAGIILYLVDRFLRQRAIFDIRNRIAADLHDELGANLHAVSLLGELASKSKNDPEKVSGLIDRIRTLAQRTSTAVKYCTNILETPGLYEDFEDAMIRNADRLLSDLDHQLVFEAEDTITKMRPGKRIDLFLFYKECLINIIRHSGATEAVTRLKTEGKKLHLQVSDNGRGIQGSENDRVPISLKRRAKLLGGKVSIENPEEGGAQVHLYMQI